MAEGLEIGPQRRDPQLTGMMRTITCFDYYCLAMKLDPELVRTYSHQDRGASVHGRFHDIAVESRTGEEITDHVMLFHEARLIEAEDLSTLSGVRWKPRHLT